MAHADGEVLRRSLDLLPTTRFVTAASDPSDAVASTAARSARLAVYEAAPYDTSAGADLSGPLTEANIGSVGSADREAFDKLTRGWPASARFAVNDSLNAAIAADPR